MDALPSGYGPAANQLGGEVFAPLSGPPPQVMQQAQPGEHPSEGGGRGGGRKRCRNE